MCNKTNKPDKTEKYFEAWAGTFPYINNLDHKKLGFEKMIDLKLHIYNVFLISMFYKCIDRNDISLPDLDNVQYYDSKIGTEGVAVQSDNVENDPSKWIDFYQKNDDNTINKAYFTPSEIYKNYIVMHSGLFEDRNDVFIIFKEVKNGAPYKLVAIRTVTNCMWFSADDIERENAYQICIDVDGTCKRIVPFFQVSDAIFDCTNLPNWDNPDKLGSYHFSKDHPERGYLEERVKMCKNACIKSISNYRYAYPYVYFDPGRGELRRGFLLPLEKEGEVVLVATVMKTDLGNYIVKTVLEPYMALEQARRVSTIEVDWMSKLL